MPRHRLWRLHVIAAAAIGFLFATTFIAAPALTETYPSRTVTIIVPYPAGGPADESARTLAQFLSNKLKQSFIVENVAGGNTIVGMEKVARSTADGTTLLFANLQISANVTLYNNLPFDTVKDFAPVMLVNRNPLILAGRTTLEPKTLAGLVGLMKKQRLKAAIPGYGATGHLATALFAQEAGAKLDLIPYRGAAPAITDLLGGHVDLFFGTPQSFVQQVATGALRDYGITAKDKLPEFPNAESLPKMLGAKLDVVYWQGIFAPAGTPDAVIKTLNDALQQAVSDPAIVKNWAAQDVTAFPPDQRSPTAAAGFLKSEIARWGQVIRDNDIHAE
ncbi:MAG TPA: tripartite tricarboxylate transporter substrate binding protein [Xanthobacteraceae bacterium]|jgi:tripartite-type tricarboxylate transporter receptor subunit TctC|nr:tripartite tricarboxylate transporter substrate binding protein [Xanthobacteraceae bacterium]